METTSITTVVETDSLTNLPEFNGDIEGTEETSPDITVEEAKGTLEMSSDEITKIKEKVLWYQDDIDKSYIEIGKLLLEAKCKLKPGHWLPWLREVGKEMDITVRTAQRYMQVAKRFANTTPVSHLEFSKALLLAKLDDGDFHEFIEWLHKEAGSGLYVENLSKRKLQRALITFKKKINGEGNSKKKDSSLKKDTSKNKGGDNKRIEEDVEDSSDFYIAKDNASDCFDIMCDHIKKQSNDPQNQDVLIHDYKHILDEALDALIEIIPEGKSIADY
jgi:hypothetical protein